jgi:DNA-binding NarL/FixJ family response regulator
LTRTRLLVAENHLGMRERIVAVLELNFDVVGTVGDGLALVEAAARMKPDLCVIDISMPSLSGIEAAIEMKKAQSDLKIVFLTVHEDPDFVRAALATGALGYVLKSKMTTDLSTAVKEAMAGRLFVSPSVPYVTQDDPPEDGQ